MRFHYIKSAMRIYIKCNQKPIISIMRNPTAMYCKLLHLAISPLGENITIAHNARCTDFLNVHAQNTRGKPYLKVQTLNTFYWWQLNALQVPGVSGIVKEKKQVRIEEANLWHLIKRRTRSAAFPTTSLNVTCEHSTVADPGFPVGGANPLGVLTSDAGTFRQKCVQKQKN